MKNKEEKNKEILFKQVMRVLIDEFLDESEYLRRFNKISYYLLQNKDRIDGNFIKETQY